MLVATRTTHKTIASEFIFTVFDLKNNCIVESSCTVEFKVSSKHKNNEVFIPIRFL